MGRGWVEIDLAKLSRKGKRINITPARLLTIIDQAAAREGGVGGGVQGRKLLDDSGAEGTLFTMRVGWQHPILTASVVSATPG